jgi:tetratricopeptide (TPR) repeat protein
MDALYNAWIGGREEISDSKPTVSELNNIKIDNGFINLYPYSFVLLDEYRNHNSEKLLNYAILLSPSMSDPYFELSYHMLTGKNQNYSFAAINLLKAVRTFFDDPYNILRFASNRLINITISILIVFFIFSLLLIIRYYMQIYMSIKSYLPEYVPAYAIVLFSIVVIVLPFLFGIGFLWLLVLWLFITFTYQKLTERIVSVSFIIFLGMLTFISLIIVATILKPEEEPFTGIMNINYGNVSTKDINALKTYADANAGDFYSNLYMGVYYKRVGDYPVASLYYKRLQDNGYGNLPEVMCDVGNLDYAMGNVGAAEYNYKQAITVDPGFFPARYNLGQLYFIKGNIEGTNELDIAKNINPALFGYYASVYQKSNINRIFVDALPDPRELAYVMFKDTFNNFTAIGLSDVMVSRLIKWPSAKRLPYLALWLLFLFMGIVILSKFIKKYFRCRSCGRLYDLINRNDEYGELICGDCLRFYIKNEIKDNKKKVEITQRVYKWKKRLKTISIGSSIIIPGSGYILRGQTIRGMLMLSIVCYLIVEYITSFGLITSIFPVFNPSVGILKSTTVFLLTIVYLSNIFFAVKIEAKWY